MRKCLLSKHVDKSLIKNHVKAGQVWRPSIIPALRRENYLDSQTSCLPTLVISEVWVQLRNSTSINNADSNETGSQYLPTYMHHTYICDHTRDHIHNIYVHSYHTYIHMQREKKKTLKVGSRCYNNESSKV